MTDRVPCPKCDGNLMYFIAIDAYRCVKCQREFVETKDGTFTDVSAASNSH